MLFQIFLFPIYFFLLSIGPDDEVFFKSNSLLEIELTPVEGEFFILDDNGEPAEIMAMKDKEGIPYWYRRIFTPVCFTGECLMVDVGLYWYCTGEFYGLEVYGEHLTKTDHSIFLEEDYKKLINTLKNDWSSLREYEFAELVDESEEGVDGTSGATKKEIAEEAVQDAVYTTYTLWHLVHVGEKEQLVQLTADLINQGMISSDFWKRGNKKYQHFLLELLASGRISSSPTMGGLLVEGLNTDEDPFLKMLAIKALPNSDLYELSIQKEIVKLYPKASIDEKLQILAALKGLDTMHGDLIDVLASDLNSGNDWFTIRLLGVLKEVSAPSDSVVFSAQSLLKSENPLVKKAAEEFLLATNL